MKILIAPDSFKGSLSSAEVANIIEEKIKGVLPFIQTQKIPLADGGEGSIDVIAHTNNLQKIHAEVKDPFFRPVNSYYYFDSETKTAYIEMAQASGLTLLKKDEPDCVNTTTYGTGELIAHALKKEAQTIYIFVGGSATNDGGMGAAEALGFRFFDKNGKKLTPIGKNLNRVSSIEDTNAMQEYISRRFIVATDVNNPFSGENGAAQIYAAQKGATTQQIRELDNGLMNFARVIKQAYGIVLQNIPGTGAAGGLGGGAYVFMNATIQSGADIIFRELNFEDALKDADLVITGEGKVDNQSLYEKLIAKVAARAKPHNTPIWLICGYFEGEEKWFADMGIKKIFPLTREKSHINDAITQAKDYLAKASIDAANTIKKYI